MIFREYTPTTALQPFIEAYWIRQTRSQTTARRGYADGCADLMLNLGESTLLFAPKADTGESIPLQAGALYLGGTMSAYGVVRGGPCLVAGVRFRPGGLFTLYGVAMKPAVDRVVAFSDPALHALLAEENGLPASLDAYFLSRPRFGRHDFGAIYEVIRDSRGQLSVEDLASARHLSRRTLERVFTEYTGI